MLITTGFPPKKFVDALSAEGVPIGWGYTGKPIYLCSQALADKRTFGNSKYPFETPYYGKNIEYKEGLCPVAEEELKRLGIIYINETTF